MFNLVHACLLQYKGIRLYSDVRVRHKVGEDRILTLLSCSFRYIYFSLCTSGGTEAVEMRYHHPSAMGCSLHKAHTLHDQRVIMRVLILHACRTLWEGNQQMVS